MSSSSSQPLVLEYKKRRFDGDAEKEMIEQIELQHRIFEQQQLASTGWPQVHSYHPPTINPMTFPTENSRPNPQPSPSKAPEKLNLSDKLYKAFVLPYIELILGLSGVFIGSVMFVSIMKGTAKGTDILKHERDILVKQSWIVIGNSLCNIFKSPWQALKLCRQ